jgi:hypothetical protein
LDKNKTTSFLPTADGFQSHTSNQVFYAYMGESNIV